MGARFSVDPPIEPMLAKPIGGLPASAEGLAFEPKWDGFRVVAYRRGDDVVLQGRMRASDAAASGAWDLSYAFPEMVARLRALRAEDLVVDGELVVIADGRLAFDALQMRLRPRKEEGGWKIAQLARDLPTSFVAFDLLGLDGRDLRGDPSRARRAMLEQALAGEEPPIHVTPQTRSLDTAARWFAQVAGAGLDGLIARPVDGVYTPGKRTLFKVKHQHTVDVVCAGWRPYAKRGPNGEEVVGSILIGLHDDAGVLQMIGAIGAFPMRERAALVERLRPFALPEDAEHPWQDPQGRAPGMPSRWRAGKDDHWYPLRPELVVEVTYDQVLAGRMRHVAGFVRWRPDKDPADCTMADLVAPEPLDIHAVLGARG
ncbi:MAG: ATP-dependent DNA ligase [Candidatus Nanopelagicales bacterium]|nr:ATP-dependent DNA ligase [Candidatus Nanopelagicales bacterium]